ncbi:MAG: hypothetical protein IJC41_07030 [Firmicutes bacterium]|nr:hypothetical protein [Bacillota bacterium]
MKKKTLALILALVALLSLSAFAVFADPGTSDDPLVSKSYVDAQIASVKSQSSGTYSIVHIDAGQTVVGKEGTEIIVRSGVVTAIDNGANGVSDLTTGKDLMSGTEIGLNHLLLVPRDDGRGVKAWTEAYLMVRGGYTLK